jgi:hypothetical protein
MADDRMAKGPIVRYSADDPLATLAVASKPILAEASALSARFAHALYAEEADLTRAMLAVGERGWQWRAGGVSAPVRWRARTAN